MPKYWVKIILHMGDSLKWVKSKRQKEKKRRKKRAKVGDDNDQATHGACKHAWRTQAASAKINLGRLDFLFDKDDI